ncbi:hypothetical protein PTKIN_Ptkin04bG0072000 [Pterospermum kingtungense]
MDGDEKRKNTSLGEVSFSSYRSTANEIFVHKLAEPAIQHPHPAISPNGGILAPLRFERNRTKEGELGVFGAESYFNMMKVVDDSPRLDDEMTPRRWPGTPSASSEASWNSRTVLLRSLMRNQYENKKVDGRGLFSNLSCSRSCSDGKSVYVNQNVDHGKEYRKQHNQINHRPINMDRRKLPQAQFQVKDEFDSQSFGLNRQVYFGAPVGIQNATVNTQLDDPRNSLEVVGSNAMKKRDIVKKLERKLSMITWEAIPNAPTLSSISRSTQVGDDIESDASSDLFEIDNISGNGQALFTRQASDGMSSCITPYAPSETSIEWSVLTASAADCSFGSGYDEMKSAESSRAPGSNTASRSANPKILLNKEAQRSRSSGILGCKSQKAVMVAETTCRRIEKYSKPSRLH